MRTILLLTLALHGCGSDSDESSGPTQAYTDYATAWCIGEAATGLYETNIKGRSVGKQDMTVSCPLAGEVRIVGTTEEGSGFTHTDDLVMSLNGCRYSSETCNITLSGDLAYKDRWQVDHDLLLKSEALTFSGTAKSNVVVYFNATCQVAIVGKDGVSGLMCGREFTSQQ
jgi:hypothetical protein